MSAQQSRLGWIEGYTRRSLGLVAHTYSADYSVRGLIERGYLDPATGYDFLKQAGLDDFAWHVVWAEDFETPDEMLVPMMEQAQGYAIFVHGWTGNRHIWEDLPGKVAKQHRTRQLVSIAIDHNGFGLSAFTDRTPSLDTCNPPAAMRTLQNWVDLMCLRRQPGQRERKVLNFVGHSMGGATLFYMNPIHWNYGEATRYALAPALLLEDDMHRAFFSTLGLGIGILQRVPVLEVVERFIKPTVINTLCGGSSDLVKELHRQQYDETPRGITGATFMAMGRLRDSDIPYDWDLMRVMLGHRDVLVGLTPMIDLLCRLEFPAANLRVVAGTHYMFSIDNHDITNAAQHVQNRDLVVEDVLALHEQAHQRQLSGYRVG